MTTAVLSNYLENKIIDHVLRNTGYTSPGTSIYVSLHTANPDENGSGAEVVYTNYARVQVSIWDSPSGGATANTGAISFPTPGGNGDNPVTHVGIWDASTEGNLLFYGALGTSKTIQNGIPFSIAAGDLDVSLAGAFSTYLQNALLSHILRNTAYTSPGTSIYVGLSTSQDEDAGGSEVSGNNYARVQVSTWDAASNGATANTGAINFPTPSGSWGTPDSIDIWDAPSAGNLLFFGSATGGGAIGSGDAVSISAGDLDVSVS